MVTDVAFKECFLHVWNDGRGADNKTFDANEAVHVYLELASHNDIEEGYEHFYLTGLDLSSL